MGRELKRIVVVLVVGLVIAQTSFAAAEECRRENERNFKGQVERIIDELNLTPEQSEQIKEQRSQYRQSLKQLRNLLRQKQEELKAELEKEESDIKKLGRIAVDIKELQSRIIDQRVESVLGVKEILTPGQYRMFCQRSKELRCQTREGGAKRRSVDDFNSRPAEADVVEADVRHGNHDRRRSFYYSIDDLKEFESLKDAGIINVFEFNDMKEKVLKNEGRPRKNIDLDSSIFDRLRTLKDLKNRNVVGLIDYDYKKEQLLAGFPDQERPGSRQGRCSIFEALRELHALRLSGIIDVFDFNKEKEQLLRWY